MVLVSFVLGSVSVCNTHWTISHYKKRNKKKRNKKSNAQTTLIQVYKITKMVLVMSLKYMPVTQSILCLVCLMCVALMHP